MSKNTVTRERIIRLSVVAFCVITVLLGAVFASRRAVMAKSAAKFTVVIDAGHGGIDGGVTGVNTGVVESEFNLAVAKLLKEDFTSAGSRVVMTRTTAAGLYGNARKSLKKADMQARRKIIEKADPCLVISVHMNRYALPSRRGAQVFYATGSEQSKIFAECVQNRLNGMDEAPRQSSPLGGDYYVLNVSPCPAVIVECGFLSSPLDEALLITEEYRKKLAFTVFTGAVAYLSNEGAFLEKTP